MVMRPETDRRVAAAGQAYAEDTAQAGPISREEARQVDYRSSGVGHLTVIVTPLRASAAVVSPPVITCPHARERTDKPAPNLAYQPSSGDTLPS